MICLRMTLVSQFFLDVAIYFLIPGYRLFITAQLSLYMGQSQNQSVTVTYFIFISKCYRQNYNEVLLYHSVWIIEYILKHPFNIKQSNSRRTNRLWKFVTQKDIIFEFLYSISKSVRWQIFNEMLEHQDLSRNKDDLWNFLKQKILFF